MKTPQEVLTELFNNWPDPNDTYEAIRANLGEYLEPDFNMISFRMLDQPNKLKMNEPFIYGDRAKILLEPNFDLVLMIRHHKTWRVSVIAYLCPACFGTGMILSESGFCFSCTGTGWGNIGDVDFCRGQS